MSSFIVKSQMVIETKTWKINTRLHLWPCCWRELVISRLSESLWPGSLLNRCSCQSQTKSAQWVQQTLFSLRSLMNVCDILPFFTLSCFFVCTLTTSSRCNGVIPVSHQFMIADTWCNMRTWQKISTLNSVYLQLFGGSVNSSLLYFNHKQSKWVQYCLI